MRIPRARSSSSVSFALGGMTCFSRRKKISILALAGIAVVVVTVWFILFSGRSSPRLLIGEPRLTNNFAYFTLTNRHSQSVQFFFTVEKKTDAGWPPYFAPPGTPLLKVSPATVVPPGQSSMVRVLIPFGGAPWRLRVLYSETETRRDRLIQEYRAAMDDVGLRALANKIAEGDRWYDIYGREIRQ